MQRVEYPPNTPTVNPMARYRNLCTGLALSLASATNVAQDPVEARLAMVADIKRHVEVTASYIGKSKLNDKVMEAMATVPRHEFVPQRSLSQAYYDGPLPIGSGQTISQPYIVALMSDLINPQPEHKVLEIGTGSGYQAAILSGLVKEVYSIEIIPELAERASTILQTLGYTNVKVRTGNGYLGWPEQAPFDGIIVTAGGSIPPKLLDQLSPGGRMIIPVGSYPNEQQLTLIEKSMDGNLVEKQILAVMFVPLIENF